MLLPIAIETLTGEPRLVLVRAGATKFIEPFFVDTLKHQLSIRPVLEDSQSLVRPLSYDPDDPRLVRISVGDFVQAYERSTSTAPGFIFHTARCGSTLVTQMLAESERFFVLSEPTILSYILDPLGPVGSRDDRISLLRATIHCLWGPPRKVRQR